MMVPIGSPHKANAEKLMNYYYDPEVAAKVAAWVNYITPGAGRAGGRCERIDPELAENPLHLPRRRRRSSKVKRLPHAQRATRRSDYDGEFQTVIGA